MTSIDIFVLSDHLLFARGLESLLNAEQKLKIVGQETDVGKAIKEIELLQPDIVIVDNTNTSETERPELLRILQVCPGTKVIGLSLEDNNLYIYKAAQRVVNNTADLMEAIKHSSISAVDGLNK